MKTAERDTRFDRLIDNLEGFDKRVDKLRRAKGFLLKAIEESWRSSGLMNLLVHAGLRVSVPIGEVSPMRVEVSFSVTEGLSSDTLHLHMRFLNESGEEMREGEMTSIFLDFIMMNPSPMIDVAAQFCDELGCLEIFKGKVERFGPMEYNL